MLLIQEQLSKNRVFVEKDNKGEVSCNVQSSTHERKTKTNLLFNKGKIYLKFSSLTDNIPVVIIFKAMGLESDQAVVQLVGVEDNIITSFTASLAEPKQLGVYTQRQALEFIGKKSRMRKMDLKHKRTPVEEARELLANVILNHVPVEKFDFHLKSCYLALMVRRMIQALDDDTFLDNRYTIILFQS